jgi:hypothetical protein
VSRGDGDRCHMLPSDCKSGDDRVVMLSSIDVEYIILLDINSVLNNETERTRCALSGQYGISGKNIHQRD